MIFKQKLLAKLRANYVNDHIPDDVQLVMRVIELVELHYQEVRSPEFYSAKLNISTRRLNTLLRFHLSWTMYELVQQRVHAEAEFLLGNTTLSAKEISYRLGVCNPAYFTECFKKMFGMTPTAYRRRLDAKRI